jgi:AraC-like DNA-binding protein
MGCSRSSFAAKFRAYSGMGPMRFVAHVRLAQAQTLLRDNPDLPVWKVAQRVGYESLNSFSRAFKAQFGKTPRANAASVVASRTDGLNVRE